MVYIFITGDLSWDPEFMPHYNPYNKVLEVK